MFKIYNPFCHCRLSDIQVFCGGCRCAVSGDSQECGKLFVDMVFQFVMEIVPD